MTRAAQQARRKSRQEKSRKSLREMPARQERRRRKGETEERTRRGKYQSCPYHGVAFSPTDDVTVYYAQDLDKALILDKWDNDGWPLWLIECQVCQETWMHVRTHP